MKIVMVATKDWVIKKVQGLYGCLLITDKEKLTEEVLREYKPDYVFFLHWSYKVPKEITDKYECVCFHMTDVPYGRGGSPLQNLILRGFRTTKVTALRMVEEMDAGPVYLKESLSLEGNAEEIYIRATDLSIQMIKRIVDEHIQPIPQEGEPVKFKRRTPSESKISVLPSLQSLYDFIRMLDAKDYPHAFLEYEGFHYEFRRVALYDGRLVADVVISQIEEKI
jgi:methionyl-tRNA formyltransferase